MKTSDLLIAACRGLSLWHAIRAYFPQASTYQVFEATVQKMEEQPDTRMLADEIKFYTKAFERGINQGIKAKKKSQ